MLTKYATVEVLSVEMGKKQATFRTAHRHAFDYEPKPGFLYVRSRAISSRCNDNFDEFPASEIKTAYRSFIGKPVFVNHVNDNHRRARGVCIDAALHEDVNPDGSPDTWTEVLMEVDANKFPKLAEAILKRHIERTSMGTDVDYSICSFCGNKAATPLEYCAHIPKLKGKRIYRTTASGAKEGVLVREICYGLKFFENSLLVEEPADPTAFVLGIESGDMAPRHASLDLSYQGGGDTEHRTDLSVGELSGLPGSSTSGGSLSKSAYFLDLALREDGLAISDAFGATPLPNHVGGVVSRGAQEPAGRILTELEVAPVAHQQSPWDGAYTVDVSPTMGTHTASLGVRQGETSVAAIQEDAASPRMAGGRATAGVDLRQVPLHLGHEAQPTPTAYFLGVESAPGVSVVASKTAANQYADAGKPPKKFRKPLRVKAREVLTGSIRDASGHMPTPPQVTIPAGTEGNAVAWWRWTGTYAVSFPTILHEGKPLAANLSDDQLIFIDPKPGEATNKLVTYPWDKSGSLTKAASLIQAAWDDDKHPRGQPKNRGEFATKPGGGGSPSKAPKSKDGAPKGDSGDSGEKGSYSGGSGTKTDPIKTEDPTEAATALSDGKYVRLRQPRMVSTLLDKLAEQIKASRAAGQEPKPIDLCKCTVANTNLFCVESKGIPRIKMPQLKGTPLPGSKAAERGGDSEGKVDLQEDFRHSLIASGIAIERTTEKASFLKASQNELNGNKVAGMVQAMNDGHMTVEGAPVFVSQDNYIVDGHHRWAALVGMDAEDDKLGEVDMDIERVDMDIITLLQRADEFCGEWGIPGAGFGENGGQAVQRAAILIRMALDEEESTVCPGAGEALVEGLCPVCDLPIRTENGLVVSHARLYGTGRNSGADWLEGWSASRKQSSIERARGFLMQATAGQGDQIAPAEVDTLRDELCPVCGESDTYDGDRCQVCNFVKPPDEFMDPDLDEAKRNDLRQDEDDVAAVEEKMLACDNCGSNFKGAPADGEVPVAEEATAPVVPEKTPVEVVDEQSPAKAPQDANTLRDRNTLPKPKKQEDDPKAKPQDAPKVDPKVTEDPKEDLNKPKDDEPGPPQEDAEVDAEEPETAPKAGDTCPDCGKGTLQEAAPKPNADKADGEGNPFAKDEDDAAASASDDNPFAKEDGEGKDPKKDKSDEDSSDSDAQDDDDPKDKKKKSPFPPKKKSNRQVAGTHSEGVDVTMRPALAALMEQQKVIEAQDRRIAALERGVIFVATLAGVENHPKLAGLIHTADENNPAQPIPDPPAEAPTETTPEALAPEAKDDVTSVGQTPLTDVAPDATTDVLAPVDSGTTQVKSQRKQGESTVLDEGLDLNEVDVTKPVAGTEEKLPLDQVKIETEQRIGPSTGNDPTPAFPLQGDFAQKATTGSRTIAGLRLARLRMQAGITTVADDLSLGEEIASSDISDEAMQTEIDTLSKVMASRPRQTTASRRLVPRVAASDGPSFQEPVIPIQEVVAGVDESEFLFE